jgi:hypothetical protein
MHTLYQFSTSVHLKLVDDIRKWHRVTFTIHKHHLLSEIQTSNLYIWYISESKLALLPQWRLYVCSFLWVNYFAYGQSEALFNLGIISFVDSLLEIAYTSLYKCKA